MSWVAKALKRPCSAYMNHLLLFPLSLTPPSFVRLVHENLHGLITQLRKIGELQTNSDLIVCKLGRTRTALRNRGVISRARLERTFSPTTSMLNLPAQVASFLVDCKLATGACVACKFVQHSLAT